MAGFVSVITGFFGSVAFVTTMIGMVPQVYKAIKSKSMRDVSMIMLLNSGLCSFSWIIYGVGEGAMTVAWSNMLALAVSIVLVAQKLHYDKR